MSKIDTLIRQNQRIIELLEKKDDPLLNTVGICRELGISTRTFYNHYIDKLTPFGLVKAGGWKIRKSGLRRFLNE